MSLINSKKQRKDFNLLNCTFDVCPFFFSLPWMHHPHTCVWLSPDGDQTHLLCVFICANMTLLGSCNCGSEGHRWCCYTQHFQCCLNGCLLNDDSALMNKTEASAHTPNPIQKITVLKVSSLPAPSPLSFHLLSDGSITPCLPELPSASLHHLLLFLLTSSVAVGSGNRSSPSSSSWKSVCCGGGSLAVSAMVA